MDKQTGICTFKKRRKRTLKNHCSCLKASTNKRPKKIKRYNSWGGKEVKKLLPRLLLKRYLSTCMYVRTHACRSAHLTKCLCACHHRRLQTFLDVTCDRTRPLVYSARGYYEWCPQKERRPCRELIGMRAKCLHNWPLSEILLLCTRNVLRRRCVVCGNWPC